LREFPIGSCRKGGKKGKKPVFNKLVKTIFEYFIVNRMSNKDWDEQVFMVEDLREGGVTVYRRLSVMCKDMRFTESTMRRHFGAVRRDGGRDKKARYKIEKNRYLIKIVLYKE
jgi:hypothetical protein